MLLPCVCVVQLQCDIVSLEEKVQELQEENKKLMLKGKEQQQRSIAEREGEVRELHHHLEMKTEALTKLQVIFYFHLMLLPTYF